ncbi:thermospermine synthase ACAULIS5 [Senna tora]|uniref:Thermospermine synthase ACAULIS5 n=1 Tax=Senna tora TaxID=362788 RepID=A0A834WSZ3_9FABA|nr:thermospermine synthase ACAULIS5 [Senna tora]
MSLSDSETATSEYRAFRQISRLLYEMLGSAKSGDSKAWKTSKKEALIAKANSFSVWEENEKDVMEYTTHVPFLADTWGWVMASDQPILIGAEEMDKRIEGTIIIMCKFSLLNNKFMCSL